MSGPASQPPVLALGSRLIAGILSAGGLAILTLGICLLAPALQSASWPTAPGVIVGHRVDSVHQEQGTRFQVGVSYSFRVGRTTHVGKGYSHTFSALPMTYPSREAAAAAYAQESSFRDWQAGRVISAFYDPRAPEVAVLQTGSRGLAWGVIVLGSFLLIISGVQWSKFFRGRAATSAGGSSAPKG